MRVNLIILGLLLAAAPAALAAGRVLRMTETLSLAADGSAQVSVQFNATAAAGDTLILPYAFTTWPDTIVHGGKIGSATERLSHGRRQLMLTLAESVTVQDTLRYAFTLQQATPLGGPAKLDFGNFELSYRMVHTSPAPLERFTVEIILPEHFVVNTIQSSTPARPANAGTSPYKLGMIAGRHRVTLTDSTVLQGEAVALAFQTKSGRKSPLFIAVLVLIAGVYLILFRDLVFPGRSKA